MEQRPFHFKKFSIFQEKAGHPVGTDGVLLGAWADVRHAKKILDIGTGTGVIALMLAQRTAANNPVIVALEPNDGSFECATENFRRSAWNDFLKAEHQTIQAYSANCSEKFDLIVSNPPYFQEGIQPNDSARKMARHANTLNLEDLCLSAKNILTPKGRFCVILPPTQAQVLCERAVVSGLYYTKMTLVRSRQKSPAERIMVQFENNPMSFVKDELVIYADNQDYTPAYQSLTKDFYLHLK